MGGDFVKLLVESYGKSSTGSITTHHFSGAERSWRSVKVGIIGLVFSCISILIPVAHFILVPLGFLTTIFLVLRSLKQIDFILAGQATCPHCQIKLTIEKQPLRFPIDQGCPECLRSIRMTPQT